MAKPEPRVLTELAAVFIVATANDPSISPSGGPMLATPISMRWLRHRIEKISRRTVCVGRRGFTGAGIEQAIVAAQYEVHATDGGLDTATLLAGLRGTRPLSVVRAEEIEALRLWAADRTVAVD